MKVISVFNKKGGVAKTISSINIGAVLQEKGYRVLIVDIDPQGNSSVQLNNREVRKFGVPIECYDCYSTEYDTVKDIFLKTQDITEVIKKTAYPGMDIITANNDLELIDRELLLDQRNDQIHILKSALDKVKSEYDYCIIDCPPNLNLITINGLMASDELLVPLKIDQMSVDGISSLLNRIDELKSELGAKLLVKGCFITMDKPNASVNKAIKEMLGEMLGEKLINTTIRDDVKVVESTYRQKPVVFYKKKCNASKDYRDLVEELYEI